MGSWPPSITDEQSDTAPMVARPSDAASASTIRPTSEGPRFAAPSVVNSAFSAVSDNRQGRALRGTDARRSNLSLVLQCLYDQPDLSRAEVARRTGLTRATVSDLVAVLVDEGLVAETGRGGGAQVGKPSVMLGIRDAWDIIALDLSAPSEVVGAIHSLRGERRHTIALPLGGATGQAAVDLVCNLIDQLAAAAEHPLLGIGVGTPGTIDADGVVLTSRSFGWHNVPLQELLRAHSGLPVAVVNDANAAAVAEQAFANGPANLLRVQITLGVGAGLLLGGQLVVGTSAAAGEIGHLVVEYQGQKCLCGKRGCLETWASVPAL
ncbi:MAG: ROK family protein, partial [Propionibacteriaceae bacterium]|nr:ROK family protein [Propionibacteriaceae bacterium]